MPKFILQRIQNPLAVLVAIAVMTTLISLSGLIVTPASAIAGDGATSNIQLYDTNANGKINRITFFIANPNGETWQLVGAAPHGLSVTDGGNDVTISTVSIAGSPTANPVIIQLDLDEGDSDLTTNTAVGSLELVYTQETGDHTCTTCLNDSTDEELNTIGTGDSGATDTETDEAAPVLYYIRYEDSDLDGKIDEILLGFSETIVSASVIAPDDLLFTNVGDFTGMAFGSSSTDVVTGSSSQWTVTLGTEATVIDTHEGSGNLAMSTQGDFSIQDAAGNINANLGALSLSSIQDTSEPVIASFTYQDADADNKIDQVTVTFSETVTAASVLGANDLVFTNVGDFTGAVFGADATDLITGSVSSVAVALGTEATVIDTDEDSGNIAISTQNAFSITDGTNTNSILGAQVQASFIDGATHSGSSRRLLEETMNQSDISDQTSQDDNTEISETEEMGDNAIPEEEMIEETNQTEQPMMVHFGKDLLGNDLMKGSLVKVAGHPGVYYVDEYAKRHAFPHHLVYMSWYGDDFSDVVEVDSATLSSMELGDPVPYRPGTMIKIPSIPKVYLLVGDRQMRHIASEQVAMDIFGDDWNTMVKDVEETFFMHYVDLDQAITSADQVALEGLAQDHGEINGELN